MKKTKILVAFMSIVAIIACTLSFVSCNEKKEDTNKTLVTLDINPSIEMVVDKDGKVVSVAAANDDANVLLYGADGILNVSIEDATSKILDLSVEYGYLTEENAGVAVNVVGSSEKVEENVKTKITTSIKSSKVSFELNISSDISFAVERKLASLKEKYPDVYKDVTASKLKLAMSACAYDKDLKLEDAVKMENGDLIKIVEDGENQTVAYATTAYKKAVESLNAVYEKSVELAKAGVYAEKYISFAESGSGTLGSILGAASRIEDVAKYSALVSGEFVLKTGIYTMQYLSSIEISQEDAASIAEILEVDVNELKDEDGKVTGASIDAYIDKLVKNATSDAKTEINNKLDQVEAALNAAEDKAVEQGEDSLGLYNEMKTVLEAIKEVMTIDIDLTKLTSIEAYEEALSKIQEEKTALKEQMDSRLTQEQLDEIKKAQDEVVASMQTEYTKLMADIDSLAQSAKDEIVALQNARRNSVA